jgi:sugar phosphate isomerase/epimerase
MRAPLAELLAVAGNADFDAVSITPALFFEALAAGMSADELRNRRDDAGVAVVLIDPLMSALPGSPDPETVGGRFANLFRYGEEDCYRIAEALDVHTLNVAHYMAAKDVPVPALVDGLGALCRRAAAHELKVLLEFIPDGSVPNLATALAIVRATGATNLAVMFDTWHFFRTGGTLGDLDTVRAGEVGGVQVSDAPAAQAGVIEARLNSRLLPGNGVIPIREVVARALADDSGVFIGIEVFSDELNQLPLIEAAVKARQSMRAVVA